MMTTILASILALLAIGWVLRINAKDRKRFEEELNRSKVQDEYTRFRP
jgi:hypothetical protein